MVLAELAVSPVGSVHRLARHRVLMALVAVAAFLVAASPLAGPEGLIPGNLGQFVVKTAMGAVVAAALLAPLVLDRPDTRHRFLGSTVMVTLGRWSYGLFVWHLAALAMVFPMIGEFPFSGHMPLVLVLTVIFGFAIAAVSYALVESPCREALRRWEYRHRGQECRDPGNKTSRRRWTVRSATRLNPLPRGDLLALAHRRASWSVAALVGEDSPRVCAPSSSTSGWSVRVVESHLRRRGLRSHMVATVLTRSSDDRNASTPNRSMPRYEPAAMSSSR